jgi:hypothetical protein
VTDHSDLQFDRAQFDAASTQAACKVCSTPLHGSYFEVNGETVCERCCYALRDDTPVGSRAGRVLRATAAGIGAGLAGTALYWAILAATGYEFGLIAIVVGFAVGKAVHWGARGRGGWAYQTLAMVLTYLAIVSASVPLILTELSKRDWAAQTQSTPAGETTPEVANASVTAADEDEDAEEEPAPEVANVSATTADAEARPAGLATMVLAFGALLLFACALPFISGIQNVVGIIIIGIGVYEAWKLNRKVELVITGPHALASPAAARS